MYIDKTEILFDVSRFLLTSLSNNKIKQLIEQTAEAIVLIPEPSEELKNIALTKNINLIEFITNPTINEIKFVLSRDETLIRFIKNPPLEISLALIDKDIEKFLPLIQNKDKTFYLELIKKSTDYVKYVPLQYLDEPLKIELIEADSSLIRFFTGDVNMISDTMAEIAIKNNPENLKYIENQTLGLIKTALSLNKRVFKFIKTEKLKIDEIKELAAFIESENL